MSYTDEETKEGDRAPALGPLYFRADRIAEQFAEAFEGETFNEVTKDIANRIYNEINNKMVEYLIYDTENNLRDSIRRTVEDEIERIMAGEKLKYISEHRASYLRARIFRKYGDQLRNERIKDLEDQVDRFNIVRY